MFSRRDLQPILRDEIYNVAPRPFAMPSCMRMPGRATSTSAATTFNSDALIVIRTEFPGAKVIVLTTYEGDAHILRALKAGAQGYLLKNTLYSELLQTIRAVHAGRRGLSPEVSFEVAQHVSDQTLTPAEVAVLRLIADGNANKQIADQLRVTEDTVKGRVKSILAKLDANDRTHAAILGLKKGIIEL